MGWESSAIDSQHSAGSQPHQTHEFSACAHSEHKSKQSICKGSHKNLDELKEGWFFTNPLYLNLALSWLLFKAGEREHLLENLESYDATLLAFTLTGLPQSCVLLLLFY